jgi:hypothetical protein
MSGSSAAYLAEAYAGAGTSIDEFAGLFPGGSYIIDYGAGRSDLGAAVAVRRPDVTWVNYDIRYRETETLLSVSAGAPANLEFRPGNAAELDESMEGQFDHAFSYNLIGHMVRVHRSLGRCSVVNMIDSLNETGRLSLGPVKQTPAVEHLYTNGTLHIGPETDDATIEDVLDAFTKPWLADKLYDAMDASEACVFPAGRFEAGARGLVLSDDGGETYHRILSPGGLKLAGRLAAGLFR